MGHTSAMVTCPRGVRQRRIQQNEGALWLRQNIHVVSKITHMPRGPFMCKAKFVTAQKSSLSESADQLSCMSYSSCIKASQLKIEIIEHHDSLQELTCKLSGSDAVASRSSGFCCKQRRVKHREESDQQQSLPCHVVSGHAVAEPCTFQLFIEPVLSPSTNDTKEHALDGMAQEARLLTAAECCC